MSKGLTGLIVQALLEDDSFQEAIHSHVEGLSLTDEICKAVQAYMDENNTMKNLVQRASELEEWVDKDIVTALVKRVEELEKAANDGQDRWKGLEEATKPEVSAVLKPVLSTLGFKVVEDAHFKSYLAHEEEEGKWVIHHLYAVTYELPKYADDGSKRVTRYVLAESLEGAVGQGTCGLGLSYEQQTEVEKSATGAQLPLMLRGWSGQQF